MLAHELSHVAHRDVLVMTVAVLGRHHRRACSPAARSTARSSAAGGAATTTTTTACPVLADRAGGQPGRLRRQLPPARLLSRYRELCADRAGAFLTMKPSALASALQKITGEMAAIPQQGPARRRSAMNAFFIAPAVSGVSLQTLTSTHPSLEQRLEQLARIQAELGRPDGVTARRR